MVNVRTAPANRSPAVFSPSTTGMAAEYARTDAWAICVTLAVEGDETQTGYSFRIARELDELVATTPADGMVVSQ